MELSPGSCILAFGERILIDRAAKLIVLLISVTKGLISYDKRIHLTYLAFSKFLFFTFYYVYNVFLFLIMFNLIKF